MENINFKILKNDLINQYNENKERYNNEIIKELLSQAEQFDEQKTIIENIFSHNVGFDSDLVEIDNIGFKRMVDINFTNIEIEKQHYESILDDIDIIVESKNEVDVNCAIERIIKFKDISIKVLYNQSRRFNFKNELQQKSISFLMRHLTIKSLYARDITLAVLKQANSKSHLKLAIITAGEIKDSQSTEYILKHLKEDELFKLSAESLIKIGDLKSLDIILNYIESISLKESNKLFFFNNMSKEFVNFGPIVIIKVLEKYNNCHKYWIRPIYSKILESFAEDLTPILMQITENESDYIKLKHIFILLGKMRINPAINFLIDTVEINENKKKLAIIALGYCKSEQTTALLEDILEEGKEDVEILREAILSLSYIGNKNTSVNIFKKYTESLDEHLKIFSIFSLARYNYKEYLDELIFFILNGTQIQIKIVERIIPRLFKKQVVYISEQLLNVKTEKEMMNVLKVLQRIKKLPKEVGNIFMKVLEINDSKIVKLEIYKIIAKVANTENEILPQSIIFNALEKANTQHEKNQIYSIINSIPRVVSKISSNKQIKKGD